MWYRVNNRYFNFHTPRAPRARPLADGESREPSERFSGRLFPFLIGTERRPSTAVGFREGRRRLRIWSFRRPGGSGMEQASSDAAAVLFFLRKEKERNGGAKKRRWAFAHLTIPPSFASQMPPPFTQGRLPLRRDGSVFLLTFCVFVIEYIGNMDLRGRTEKFGAPKERRGRWKPFGCKDLQPVRSICATSAAGFAR